MFKKLSFAFSIFLLLGNLNNFASEASGETSEILGETNDQKQVNGFLHLFGFWESRNQCYLNLYRELNNKLIEEKIEICGKFFQSISVLTEKINKFTPVFKQLLNSSELEKLNSMSEISFYQKSKEDVLSMSDDQLKNECDKLNDKLVKIKKGIELLHSEKILLTSQ